MRVHISDVRSGDQLAEDIFNSYGLHVLSKGATLTDFEISKMYQHQVDYLEIVRRVEHLQSQFQSPTELSGTFEAAIDSLVNPELRPLYHDAVAGAEQLFERALTEGRILESDVKESFQPLVQTLRAERDVVSLLLMLNSQDDYTYQHSVQVGMLSYYIARWLGWSEEKTVRAGKAGFLHDIGKCKIPEAILNKPNKLTDEEFQEMKKHTQYGYDIICQSFDDHGVALAALQHHERIDGLGYPSGLAGEQIHPIAKVVAVADVYSAMISSRTYCNKRDLLHVLREMYELSFQQLDPDITHTFIRHMVPNFIGKKVELTSGDMGTIIMTHPTEFFRPLVQVNDQFIDLSTNRGQEIKQVFM